MSSRDHPLLSVITHLALSLDGAVLGVALAYAAVRSVLKFTSSSSALVKLREAPAVKISDLRSILNSDDSQPSDKKLVVVRGTVEAKSSVDGNWNILNSGVLISHGTKDRAVVIERTQTCLYSEWRGIIGWPSDLRTILSRLFRQQESQSLRTVPFILVEGGGWPVSDFVAVNVDGSRHSLPLTTVYHHLEPVNVSPFTFLQTFLGNNYPVGVLDVEKILPMGKDVSAVGVCSFRNGVLEIKSCKDLPYFLSQMTKDEMLVDLASRTEILFWCGIVLGSVSIAVLGYAAMRNWNKWKRWRERSGLQQTILGADNDAELEIEEEEDVGDVPDGQLCVICLMRRRRSAFIPCGHLVCCQLCCLAVEQESSPKCPLCRQDIRTSVRIYDS